MIKGQKRIITKFAWFPVKVTIGWGSIINGKHITPKKIIWLKKYTAIQECQSFLNCSDNLGFFDYDECGHYLEWVTIEKNNITETFF